MTLINYKTYDLLYKVRVFYIEYLKINSKSDPTTLQYSLIRIFNIYIFILFPIKIKI